MTVYKAAAWSDATDGTFYPPDTETAIPQDGKTLDDVRRHLVAHGMAQVGTCAREHGGQAELWGDQWPRYDGNGKVFAIWEEDAVSHAGASALRPTAPFPETSLPTPPPSLRTK